MHRRVFCRGRRYVRRMIFAVVYKGQRSKVRPDRLAWQFQADSRVHSLQEGIKIRWIYCRYGIKASVKMFIALDWLTFKGAVSSEKQQATAEIHPGTNDDIYDCLNTESWTGKTTHHLSCVISSAGVEDKVFHRDRFHQKRLRIPMTQNSDPGRPSYRSICLERSCI